ncbi:uncharacterized protein LOC135179327 isoform X5 [Pogoniulus pusillus]|uniref:uncharacterized protein LOC135179327 isoform X5 n=1 Tax=Pogoniulus pusillus TaxID=488313 RepID=UPI0030B93EB9
MARKEPLLIALKGGVLRLREVGGPCTDTSPHLASLCQLLENILRKGLQQPAWGFRRRDYWHWLEQLPTAGTGRLSPLSTSIQKAGGCEKVQTAQGHGRYFLRLALQEKVLAAAVRELAQTPRLLEFYDPVSSILGNEELLEPFLSLLLVVTEMDFSLDLQAGALLQKLKGQPLSFRLLRWRWHDGEVYEPLLPYLKVLKEKEPKFQLQHSPRRRGKEEPRRLQGGRLLYKLRYLGQTSVGKYGGKEVLAHAIPAVLERRSPVREVLFDVKETEVLVQERNSSKLLCRYPYPTISCVGRCTDSSHLFGFCVATSPESPDGSTFDCLVFASSSEQECEEIIRRIAAGFKHTEWFV